MGILNGLDNSVSSLDSIFNAVASITIGIFTVVNKLISNAVLDNDISRPGPIAMAVFLVDNISKLFSVVLIASGNAICTID